MICVASVSFVALWIRLRSAAIGPAVAVHVGYNAVIAAWGTERPIAEMYEGAEVTKSAGTVNGKNMEWWRWKDSPHFHSRYIVTLADADGTTRVIVVNVVVNSHDRLAALECAFSTIEFL